MAAFTLEVRTMSSANCPECEGEVSFEGDVMAGEIAQCPDCGVELEVVSINPLKLDKAPEEEEDWGE
jgi:alpha-aminoadipate/glutamate carrier protein LysW